MTTSIRTNQYNKAQKMFTTLVAGIIVSFVLYSYAIASTTLALSNVEDMNGDIGELQTEIAELELEYYGMLNDISIPEAESLGFTETKNIQYANIDVDSSVAYNF